MNYELIFKEGIRKALEGLNDISQIPKWWKAIEYYRDSENLKGQKMKPEYVKTMWLPDKFDISPRMITAPVKSMVFRLWDRNFDIDPKIGNIKKVYLSDSYLVIENTMPFCDVEYDKTEKIPDLFFRLWSTPRGKWEKSWFTWSTVTEI
jgi:hypothetical protein